ncbi:MAG: (d)CMP kinase [Holosporaceae bacterium]|jgi:cytidylate kinase|nr:(d)CMP kinase [Holosporaceae bacterium]
MKPVIAIDGHVCSGKGTMARLLAQHFNLAHLDSGIFYRMFACLRLAIDSDFFSAGCNKKNLEKIENISNCLSFIGRDQENSETDRSSGDNFLIELLNETSVHDLLKAKKNIPDEVLRSDVIGAEASVVGKMPEVRNILTKFIREFVASVGDEYNGSVVDGRDIGTVVFPEAKCKIFMTADPMIRAQRRLNDLGHGATLEEVYSNLITRDERDFSRDVAPLTFDENYIFIDTTKETVEESFKRLEGVVKDSLCLIYP